MRKDVGQIAVCVGIFFIYVQAWAQESSVSSSYPRKFPVTVEMGYQVHTLPMSGSQMIGPTLMYGITKHSQLGTRYLLAPDVASERRLSVFWRMTYGFRRVSFVFEPQYSYLWRAPEKNGEFSTTGIGGGINFQLNSQWYLGSLVGLEQSGSPFPFGAFWSRPYLLIFTQFDF